MCTGCMCFFIFSPFYFQGSFSVSATQETVLIVVSEKRTDPMGGDFNTLYEHVDFRKFENNYTSLHDYGHGFSAT